MSWLTSIRWSLRLKPSGKFLIIFSLCSLTIAGVVWACADGGDDMDNSSFTPEYFVARQYSPFFYASSTAYYQINYGDVNDDSNRRYNEKILEEWFNHFNHQFAKESLQFLLLKASKGAVDSVYQNYTGALKTLPAKYPALHIGTLNKKQLTDFFNYLQLAKACEKFTVDDEYYGWEKVTRKPVAASLEHTLLDAFGKSADPFIRQRLWFQVVRYYYFRDLESPNARAVNLFNNYKAQFPKNLTWYRTQGYVAGYYYHHKYYALSNYLYSQCYNYAYEIKIPSKWSFHPQNEKDWQDCLKMAKTADEKITLWHMLGMQYDEGRAIKEIVAINPKSDKLDLLLSRVVNTEESTQEWSTVPDSLKRGNINEKKLVEAVADKNNTAKPYFWNLAAGYLNYLDSNYAAAGKYYAIAKKQFPAADQNVQAQGKLLDALLYFHTLKRADAKTDVQTVAYLNWLADLRDGKIKINYLRFTPAVAECANLIAAVYDKQGDKIKAVGFNHSKTDYLDSANVERLVSLMLKTNRTPVENTMLRYYPYTVNDIYYHQAIRLAYQENLDKAITTLQKRTNKTDVVLPGNPFNSRLNDCHDCDFAAPQKQKFTTLSFLQTIKSAKADMVAGKDVYRNAYLLANAYYNITTFGNARAFYENDGTNIYLDEPSRVKADSSYSVITNMDKAAKYYLYARKNAATDEQRAKCTFMLSKCERNEYYNHQFGAMDVYQWYNDHNARQPAGEYFAELKNKYANTAYYQEALKECGYFNDYIKEAKQPAAPHK